MHNHTAVTDIEAGSERDDHKALLNLIDWRVVSNCNEIVLAADPSDDIDWRVISNCNEIVVAG